ncbi:MAG: L-2-amino-thiazoline-4-carboxylic acid hydrolase [Solobacterium sp.]|nr:L-2-amino-thiazoline-4-carboxylic acid hydrolase [Solobacterium sp.]
MKIGIEQHAVLYALLVKNACGHLGEQEGRNIMAKATYAYGIRRGQRMAAHADSRHDARDMNAFFIYGEWAGDPGENISSMSYTEDASISTVRKCAWYDAWKKHGLLKEGTLYCHYVDNGLADGFGGSFGLTVKQAIGKGDPCCVFRWNEPADPDYTASRKAEDSGKYILPFSFHCQELLDTVKETLQEAAPDHAEAILDSALNEYSAVFGREVLS